jgi:ribosomal-protein-alanine N-acetyltransferase
MTLTRIGLRDGRPAGFAMLGSVSAGWCFPKACELLAIAVASSARRMGLADLLVREMELRAALLGAERLILHTSADNEAARRLFVRRGFSFAESREKFYPEGQDAVCMIKKLDAESSGE